MNTDHNLASELAALSEPRIEELRPYFEALSAQPEAERLAGMLSSLLLDRVLQVLRRGSRLEIAEDGMHLADFLSSEAGKRLLAATAKLHGRWRGLADLLAEAARRSDRGAVDSILRSHRGRGEKVLTLLAERDEPVRRMEIRQELGRISESLLSHLLRDLDDADLIIRYRPEGSKEVWVELGPVGRELVQAPGATAVAEGRARRPRSQQSAGTEKAIPTAAVPSVYVQRLAREVDWFVDQIGDHWPTHILSAELQTN